VSVRVRGGNESSYPGCADLPSMQGGSNGRNREYRPRGARSRFDWVRVPQVRVCDACRSGAAEKANAREALICQQPTERPQMPRPAREREKVFRFENDIPRTATKFTGAPAERTTPLTVYKRIATAGGLVGSVVHASSSQPLSRLRCGSPRGIGVRNQCRHVPRAESLKFPNSGTLNSR
jgi:hypothetical protein